MDILSYLTTLVKTHKEVGIPGLGTICKRKSPGRYDTATHSFLPPSYTLSFTSDLKEQTLLTDLISKKKNISADSAHYFIEQFSQQILDELSAHQESDFGELGTFSTRSGSLTFIPKEDSNLGFDYYGLPVLKVEPDTAEVQIVENTSLADPLPNEEEQPAPDELAQLATDQPDATEQLEVIEDQPQVTEDQPEVTEEQLELENNNADLGNGADEEDERPESEIVTIEPNTTDQPERERTEATPKEVHLKLDYSDKERSGIPAYLKVIIGLIVLAVLTGLIYLAKPELFNGFLDKSGALNQRDTVTLIKSHEQAQLDSIKHADSLRISNEKAILAADSAKDSVPTQNVVPLTSAAPEITYEVIAASLLNQKEANKFLADMKRKGIPAKVADMPGRRVKISIGSFSDEETAKKELEVLRKTTKIPGIYIYKVKHTNNSK